VAAARLADYMILIKPRISLLVLLTVAAGFRLGAGELWEGARLLHALLGIALVAAGSSALNQLLERRTDAQMRRTAVRPLPSGRLSAGEVLLFGLGTGAVGVLYLALCVNGLTAWLACGTFLLYVLAYTPLKRFTSLSTAVGAVPGALPPVLGWAAAGGSLDRGALSLFAILFLWQFPHFLAIAWIYRDEYARAGLKMLPLGGRAPRVVGVLAVAYSLALIPLSLQPVACGLAGGGYAAAALLLGAGYLLAAVRFALRESLPTARGLLWASLVYLPVLISCLVWDHCRWLP
jgi:protoheme IX farnesyltransferase